MASKSVLRGCLGQIYFLGRRLPGAAVSFEQLLQRTLNGKTAAVCPPSRFHPPSPPWHAGSLSLRRPRPSTACWDTRMITIMHGNSSCFSEQKNYKNINFKKCIFKRDDAYFDRSRVHNQKKTSKEKGGDVNEERRGGYHDKRSMKGRSEIEYERILLGFGGRGKW